MQIGSTYFLPLIVLSVGGMILYVVFLNTVKNQTAMVTDSEVYDFEDGSDDNFGKDRKRKKNRDDDEEDEEHSVSEESEISQN